MSLLIDLQSSLATIRVTQSHGCLKTPNTGGAEGILGGVMNIKDPIFAKSGSMKACSPRNTLKFSTLKITFWVILHQTPVVITRPVPNACSW